MDKKIKELLKEHTDLLKNIKTLEVISKDDPDILKMEEIKKKIKELNENKSKIS